MSISNNPTIDPGSKDFDLAAVMGTGSSSTRPSALRPSRPSAASAKQSVSPAASPGLRIETQEFQFVSNRFDLVQKILSMGWFQVTMT